MVFKTHEQRDLEKAKSKKLLKLKKLKIEKSSLDKTKRKNSILKIRKKVRTLAQLVQDKEEAETKLKKLLSHAKKMGLCTNGK